MDEMPNHAVLRGSPAGRPVFSHMAREEVFYTFPLEVERLSGTPDTIPVVAPLALLETAEVTPGGRVTVTGEVRSFNNRSGQGSRLVITLFARAIDFVPGPDVNAVTLTGALCRRPNLRRTPMGRVISDMMLAVPRRYGRSDYLPCIAWGRQAEESVRWSAGDRITLTGRLQSRVYVKVLETGNVERTAYEVSASAVRRLTEPDAESPESPPSPAG